MPIYLTSPKIYKQSKEKVVIKVLLLDLAATSVNHYYYNTNILKKSGNKLYLWFRNLVKSLISDSAVAPHHQKSS